MSSAQDVQEGSACPVCKGVRASFTCPKCRQVGHTPSGESTVGQDSQDFTDSVTFDGNQALKKGINLQRGAVVRKANISAGRYKAIKQDNRIKVSAEYFEPPKIAQGVPNFKAPAPLEHTVRSFKLTHLDLPFGAAGVCCLPSDEVVVCQIGGQVIKVYTPRSEGTGDTYHLTKQWESPDNTALWGVACNQDYLFVTDLFTESVLQYTHDGTHKRTVTVGFNGGAGLSVTQNTLYITSCWDNNIYKMALDTFPSQKSRFQPVNKRVPMNMSGAGYVASSGTHVAISIRSRHQVFVFTSGGDLAYTYGTGEPGTQKGQLHTPEGVVFDSRNCLLIADCGNSRVVVVSRLGKHIGNIPLHLDGLLYPWGVALAGEGRLVVTVNNKLTAAVYQYEII
eukprot:GHVU01115102.1.p1 GENE.GHVU01115102.1~~GHVU01115102.1.p1  ORF type:complete len:394 (-),score=26.02 GHVU01115102.1:390-1571(-)